jgi:hypothetical protein
MYNNTTGRETGGGGGRIKRRETLLILSSFGERRERWCSVSYTRKPKYLHKKHVPMIFRETSICGINLLTDTSESNSEPPTLVRT